MLPHLRHSAYVLAALLMFAGVAQGLPPPCVAPAPRQIAFTPACPAGGCEINTELTFETWPLNLQPCETYAWRFGDGTTSTAMRPAKTYATPGSYNVTLVVTSPYGTLTLGTSLTIRDSCDCTLVPGIYEFKANPATVAPGEMVVFVWSVRGASKVSIEGTSYSARATYGGISSGVCVIHPQSTARYRLLLESPDGTTLRSDSVTVVVTSPRRRSIRH